MCTVLYAATELVASEYYILAGEAQILNALHILLTYFPKPLKLKFFKHITHFIDLFFSLTYFSHFIYLLSFLWCSVIREFSYVHFLHNYIHTLPTSLMASILTTRCSACAIRTASFMEESGNHLLPWIRTQNNH